MGQLHCSHYEKINMAVKVETYDFAFFIPAEKLIQRSCVRVCQSCICFQRKKWNEVLPGHCSSSNNHVSILGPLFCKIVVHMSIKYFHK